MNVAFVRCAVLGGLVAVSGAPLALASGDKEVAIRDLAGIRTVPYGASPAISPDGELVAAQIRDPRRLPQSRTGRLRSETGAPSWYTNDVYGTDIVVFDTRDRRKPVYVTNGVGNNWTPAWAPDGKSLAFYSDRDGVARLWLWEKASGTLRRLSKTAVETTARVMTPPRWTADSRQIVFKALPDGEPLALDESVPERDTPGPGFFERDIRQPALVGGPPRVLSTFSKEPSSETGVILELNNTAIRFDLAVVDVQTGKVRTLGAAREIPGSSSEIQIARDASAIAYASFVGRSSLYVDAWELRVAGLRTALPSHKLAEIKTLSSGVFAWSPDAARIAYFTTDDQSNPFGPGSRARCYVVSAIDQSSKPCLHEGKENNEVLPSGGGLETRPIWNVQGNAVYWILPNALAGADVMTGESWRSRDVNKRILGPVPFASAMGPFLPESGALVLTRDVSTGYEGFARIDLREGAVRQLSEEGRAISQGSPAAMFMTAGGVLVYIASDASHPPDLWISDVNGNSPQKISQLNPELEGVEYGPTRTLSWTTADGKVLHGALLLPADYVQGKRYPLLASVYPITDRARVAFSFGGLNGYLNDQVFATRGFAVLIPDTVMRPGHQAQDIETSVLSGVDKVIQMGVADPDRLGVYGGSAGGYETLTLITRTGRFGAAIAINPTESNVLANPFGLSKVMGSEWWEDLDPFLQNSPFYHLKNVHTPLLLLQGEADRYTLWGSNLIFSGMRALGKDVEYVRYRGEPHGFLSLADVVDFSERALQWFQRFLTTAR
jgi:dipeptidyl aminopeptidase/acylaminoacyl peptidase